MSWEFSQKILISHCSFIKCLRWFCKIVQIKTLILYLTQHTFKNLKFPIPWACQQTENDANVPWIWKFDGGKDYICPFFLIALILPFHYEWLSWSLWKLKYKTNSKLCNFVALPAIEHKNCTSLIFCNPMMIRTVPRKNRKFRPMGKEQPGRRKSFVSALITCKSHNL